MVEEYRIIIYGTIEGNVDVEVVLQDGSRFSATFFTLENIRSLMREYEKTGDCLSGEYFWAIDAVIVKTLSEDVIRATVEDLIKSNTLGKAFMALSE